MKTFIVVSLLLIGLASCRKGTMAPDVDLMEETDTTAMAKQAGVFMNGPYGTVMGKATIFKKPNGAFEVLLDSFTSSNGPDLYVYLSKEIMPANFIDLGKLKSVMGSQVYQVPGMPDFSQYKYLCIHCKAFNHLFGYALLQ